MGVSRDFVVMIGIEVDWNRIEELHSKFVDEDDWDSVSKLEDATIVDCYSDNYAYFGNVLKYFDQYDDNEHFIVPMPKNDELLEIRNNYIEMFGEEPSSIPKIIVFEHYT